MDATHETKPRRRELLAALSLVTLGGLGWAMARASGARVRSPRRHRTSPPSADGIVVDGPVALWRDMDGVHAVSRLCSHLGCQVQPAADGTLACPCHGSRFDRHGSVTAGPAGADLARLPVTIEADGKIVVDLAG